MKLTVTLREGTTLMFEGNDEELIRVAGDFAQKQLAESAAASTTPEGNGASASTKANNRRWTEHSVKKLWASLYGDQAKLVKFLVERGGKVTYDELGKHMGYNAQSLSGILSPITRNAKTATGDRFAKLVDWRISKNGDREYFADADALPLFQQIIKKP